MLGITMDTFGDADVLTYKEIASPTMKTGHVRVRVHATAVNRADISQRRGFYPPPTGESEILGLEMAGEIVEIDTAVQDFRLGERVCALLPGGGYAQEVVVPTGMLARIPQNISYVEAAAIPEVFLTAYSNLVWLGQISSGDRVLIHAGASGVGTAAIQLVRTLGGISFVTVGNKEKLDFCFRLGADNGVIYKEVAFLDHVLEWSKGNGVQIIFDFVGAPYFHDNLKSLSTDGKLIIIGTLGGNEVRDVPLGLILSKRLQVLGTALRSRPLPQKMELTKTFWEYATPLFEKGVLHPVVDKIFPLAQAAEAHRYMESNQNIGKIILQVIA